MRISRVFLSQNYTSKLFEIIVFVKYIIIVHYLFKIIHLVEMLSIPLCPLSIGRPRNIESEAYSAKTSQRRKQSIRGGTLKAGISIRTLHS